MYNDWLTTHLYAFCCMREFTDKYERFWRLLGLRRRYELEARAYMVVLWTIAQPWFRGRGRKAASRWKHFKDNNRKQL